MRLCPFCSAYNAEESSHCGTCARRLPPLSPRHRIGEGRAAGPLRVTTPGDYDGDKTTVDPGPAGPTQPALAADEFTGKTVVEMYPERGAPAASQRATVAHDKDDEDDHEWPAPQPPSVPADDWFREMEPSRGDPTPAQVRAVAAASLARADNALANPPDPPDPQSSAPPSSPNSQGSGFEPRVMMPTPPPNRVGSSAGPATSEGFEPPQVKPIPPVPEPGLINAVGYALSFVRARWQRSSAIKSLDERIKKETIKLDDLLGALGRLARSLHVDNRVLAAENQAIDEAENRHAEIERALAALGNRQAEEDRSFAEVETDRRTRVDEAQSALDRVEQELAGFEA
ncbi:MAG: hypothetical protein AAGC55_05970, partial [Myxococcota bacterium]